MLNIFAQLISNKSHALPEVSADSGSIKILFNIVFILSGAIALLMVVIAGFRYIRAGSNETIVAESRRQLVHALVGLVVIASAATIVNFVISRV
jgi:type IV secretory pathway VirB2 component (pilin)